MGGMGDGDSCKMSVSLKLAGVTIPKLISSLSQMLWNWYTVDACAYPTFFL
jgi:hypothetical protein